MGIRVDAVVEQTSDDEINSSPHKCQQKLTQQINHLIISVCWNWYVNVKVWNRGQQEKNDFKNEVEIKDFLILFTAIIVSSTHDFVVLIVNVGLVVCLQVSIYPHHFIVLSQNQTT